MRDAGVDNAGAFRGRGLIAFLCGLACMRFIYWVLFEASPAASNAPSLTGISMWLARGLAGVAVPLWFALPFIAVRFGWRDRLTQLSAMLFLLTVPVSWPRFQTPGAITVAGCIAIGILLLTLLSPAWRRATITLAATIVTGIAAIAISFFVLTRILEHEKRAVVFTHSLAVALAATVALSVLAVVCSRLHDRLSGSTNAGGAAHA